MNGPRPPRPDERWAWPQGEPGPVLRDAAYYRRLDAEIAANNAAASSQRTSTPAPASRPAPKPAPLAPRPATITKKDRMATPRYLYSYAAVALGLTRRSPSALRSRATVRVSRALEDGEKPSLGDVRKMLELVAEDENAHEADREKARRCIEALDARTRSPGTTAKRPRPAATSRALLESRPSSSPGAPDPSPTLSPRKKS